MAPKIFLLASNSVACQAAAFKVHCSSHGGGYFIKPCGQCLECRAKEELSEEAELGLLACIQNGDVEEDIPSRLRKGDSIASASVKCAGQLSAVWGR